MKTIFVIFLLTTMACYSQTNKTISWETKTIKISDKEYDLIVIATIQPNYRLYSQNVPDNSPLPTVFSFTNSITYKLIGKMKESIGQTKFDPVFRKEIKSFRDKAIFKQKIEITRKKRFKISGEITFMTCNNETCLRGNQEIEFKIK